MAEELWPHQQEAVAFVEGLWQQGRPGAMLAIPMGLGKTRIAIELITRNELYPALILAPKAVVPVWPEQFSRHVPSPPKVLSLGTGPIAKRAQTLSDAAERPEPLVAVCNYDSAWQGALRPLLLALGWRLVVCDESHRIQAPGGKQSWFAKELAKRVPRRLALSGTPLSSGPLAIYGQYRFLDTSILGSSFASFRSRYAVLGGYQNHQVLRYQRLDELSEKMGSIAYRADAAVLDLLPPTDTRLWCELEPEARRIYRALEADFVAELFAQAEGSTITAPNKLVQLLRLQQLAAGHVADDDGVVRRVSKAKAAALLEVLEGLDPEEPVVVFCRFRADLDTVHEAASELGRGSLELSGRRNELHQWQQPDGPPVLAVQIQAGGVGVDLTRARYCVFYSLGYSEAEYQQARARLHRPGQTRHVAYVHLVAAGTVDEAIYEALETKAEVVAYVLASFNRKA